MSDGLERRKISGSFVIAGRLRRGREWKNLLRYFRYDLITNAYTIVFSSNGKYNCSSGVSNWELESSSFTGLPRSSLVLTIAISVIKLHRVVRGYPWRVPWIAILSQEFRFLFPFYRIQSFSLFPSTKQILLSLVVPTLFRS